LEQNHFSRTDPTGSLAHQVKQDSQGFEKWVKSSIPQVKLTMAICREVIDNLEKAQEHRSLTSGEI
jgi:hypothetical protein